MGTVQNITVTEAEAGQKLLQFLRRRLGPESGVPDSLLHRVIRSGEVRVNGSRAKPFQRVEQGQIIRIPPVRTAEKETSAEKNSPNKSGTGTGPDPLRKTPGERSNPDNARQKTAKNRGSGIANRPDEPRVIAETPDLLVLLKPAGLPVHPGTGHADSLTARLAARYANAPFMPTPAHRLDKDTSGILLAAKTYACLARLHELFAEKSRDPDRPGSLRKEYLAWVRGEWRMPPGPVLLEDTLEKRRNTGSFERVERAKGDNGREAKALVAALEIRDNEALLLITLLTGRTHQIRAQLALRGYPIIGDRKYGNARPGVSMLLHAWRITLPDGKRYRADPAWGGEFDVSRALESLES